MFAPPNRPSRLSSCHRAQYLVRSTDFADAGAFTFYSTSVDLLNGFNQIIYLDAITITAKYLAAILRSIAKPEFLSLRSFLPIC